MLTRRWTRVATAVGVLTLLVTGCAVGAQPEQQDYAGTWVLDGASGDEAPASVVSADRTYRARDIPTDLACRTGNAATSPPGCAADGDPTSLSGRWEAADGDSPGIRFSFDGHFVRQGYASDGGLDVYVGSLDVPRPDYRFVRLPSD